MTFRRIPVSATFIPFSDIIGSFLAQGSGNERLSLKLKSYFPAKYVFLCNSGLASLYLILRALKCLSSRNEIILPAYTAPSLMLPIRRLKIKPVLCDISLEDFNLDLNQLTSYANADTLSILQVYSFGIVSRNIEYLKKSFPGIFIIEDCAQAMGSKIGPIKIGKSGHIGFFSFNRGKNLPTYGGGCIVTDEEKIAAALNPEVSRLPSSGQFANFTQLIKISALSLAVRPLIYGLLYPFISCFKDVEVPDDFTVNKSVEFQAHLAAKLLEGIEKSFRKRYENALTLLEELKDVESIRLPKFPSDAHCVLNRFPVVFKDPDTKVKAQNEMRKAGFETSCMYLKPIHHIFDLGYRREEFPHAVYLAERLLTLPIHPLLKSSDLDRMVRIVRKL